MFARFFKCCLPYLPSDQEIKRESELNSQLEICHDKLDEIFILTIRHYYIHKKYKKMLVPQILDVHHQYAVYCVMVSDLQGSKKYDAGYVKDIRKISTEIDILKATVDALLDESEKACDLSSDGEYQRLITEKSQNRVLPLLPGDVQSECVSSKSDSSSLSDKKVVLPYSSTVNRKKVKLPIIHEVSKEDSETLSYRL